MRLENGPRADMERMFTLGSEALRKKRREGHNNKFWERIGKTGTHTTCATPIDLKDMGTVRSSIDRTSTHSDV